MAATLGDNRPQPCSGISVHPLSPAKRRLTPRGIEPVADAADGHQVRRLLGFGLDLRTQPADMDVDGSRITVMTVAPRSVEQLAAGPGASRVAGQDGKQIELLGPQVNELAIPP